MPQRHEPHRGDRDALLGTAGYDRESRPSAPRRALAARLASSLRLPRRDAAAQARSRKEGSRVLVTAATDERSRLQPQVSPSLVQGFRQTLAHMSAGDGEPPGGRAGPNAQDGKGHAPLEVVQRWATRIVSSCHGMLHTVSVGSSTPKWRPAHGVLPETAACRGSRTSRAAGVLRNTRNSPLHSSIHQALVRWLLIITACTAPHPQHPSHWRAVWQCGRGDL